MIIVKDQNLKILYNFCFNFYVFFVVSLQKKKINKTNKLYKYNLIIFYRIFFLIEFINLL